MQHCALFQLDVARTYVDYHAKEFGYKKPNVSFVQGYIEALTEAGLEKSSFDIIMWEVIYSLSLFSNFMLCNSKEMKLKRWFFFFSTVPTAWWISLQTRREFWLKPTACSRYTAFGLTFGLSLQSSSTWRQCWDKRPNIKLFVNHKTCLSMWFALIFTSCVAWMLIFRMEVSCTSVTSTAVED